MEHFVQWSVNGVTYYAFADDLAIMTKAKKENELERIANRMMMDDNEQIRSGTGKNGSGGCLEEAEL